MKELEEFAQVNKHFETAGKYIKQAAIEVNKYVQNLSEQQFEEIYHPYFSVAYDPNVCKTSACSIYVYYTTESIEINH